MKESLKEYFYFNKKERNGILVLIIILFLIIIFNKFSYLLIKPEKYDFTAFNAEIDEFRKNLKPVEADEYLNKLDSAILNKYENLILFEFDPNTTTSEQFLNLGLTEKQIKTINNYRDKGGSFKIKSDFQKIYGIRQKQYEILKPYILLSDESTDISNNYNDNYEDKTTETQITLFEFNPNTISESDWKLLGMTDKQIKTITNFKVKGGKFYKKEDLAKIYSISTDEYKKLEPYIIFDSPKTEEKEANITEKTEIKIVSVNINNATNEELIALNGIGEYLAKSIIKYRKLLGGFYDKKQLLEVYGLKQETYDKIQAYIIIDETEITKIRINFADIKELNAHPYIEYEDAKAIINYISKNGPFSNIQQLSTKKIVSEEIYTKIKFYLTVD